MMAKAPAAKKKAAAKKTTSGDKSKKGVKAAAKSEKGSAAAKPAGQRKLSLKDSGMAESILAEARAKNTTTEPRCIFSLLASWHPRLSHFWMPAQIDRLIAFSSTSWHLR